MKRASHRNAASLCLLQKVLKSVPADTAPPAAPSIACCNGAVASTMVLCVIVSAEAKGGGGGDGSDDEGKRERGGVGLSSGSSASNDKSRDDWGNKESRPIRTGLRASRAGALMRPKRFPLSHS